MKGFMGFKYPHLILSLILLDIIMVAWSCTSRSNLNVNAPTIPSDVIEKQSESGELPILVSSVENGNVISGVGVLGLYQISLNTAPVSGESIQVRQSTAIGDPHEVDITNLMTGQLNQDCFKLTGVENMEDEQIAVRFSIRHPYSIPDHNPPQPDERIDLHVFDLSAIVFLKDSGQSTTFSDLSAHVSLGNESPTLSLDDSGFEVFEEWDGFTSHFDSQIDKFFPTTSTLHPYKILSLDPSHGNVNALSVNGFNDVREPSGHNVFAQGSEFESVMKFNVPKGESVDFLLALTACYGQSAQGKGNMTGQRGNPRYFVPEFNMKNAWKLEVEIPEESDRLSAGDTESSTLLIVKVWDWQQNYGYPMDDIDPYSSRLDALHNSSRVNSVVVEIPGVNDLDVSNISYGGTGFEISPLIYMLEIQNDKKASEGDYYGLVGVIDELHGTVIDNYGIERDSVSVFDVADFVTYAPVRVHVKNGDSALYGVLLHTI